VSQIVDRYYLLPVSRRFSWN